MLSDVRRIACAIGLTWSVGFLLLMAAGLVGLLPGTSPAASSGFPAWVVGSFVSASFFALPLSGVAMASALGQQRRFGVWLAVGLSGLLMVSASGPHVWRDWRGLFATVLVCSAPVVTWGVMRSSLLDEKSIGEHALEAIAVIVTCGGLGVILSAGRGVIEAAPGMQSYAAGAHSTYFSIVFGVVAGLATVVGAVASAVGAGVSALRRKAS